MAFAAHAVLPALATPLSYQNCAKDEFLLGVWRHLLKCSTYISIYKKSNFFVSLLGHEILGSEIPISVLLP